MRSGIHGTLAGGTTIKLPIFSLMQSNQITRCSTPHRTWFAGMWDRCQMSWFWVSSKEQLCVGLQSKTITLVGWLVLVPSSRRVTAGFELFLFGQQIEKITTAASRQLYVSNLWAQTLSPLFTIFAKCFFFLSVLCVVLCSQQPRADTCIARWCKSVSCCTEYLKIMEVVTFSWKLYFYCLLSSQCAVLFWSFWK